MAQCTAACTSSFHRYGVAGYCASGREVERVYLGDTNLAGSLPTQIGYLTSVSAYFRIDYNSLHGALPTQFGKLKKLDDLALSQNELVGTLPTQLGALSAMKVFQIQRNQVMDKLPTEIGSLTSAVNIIAESNAIGGQHSCEYCTKVPKATSR